MPRLTTLHKVQDAHDQGVWSASWVPGSNRLLTGSVDENVKVWDDTAESLKFHHIYQGHILGVISVAVDASGTLAASSALDSIIRVWDLHTHSTVGLMETASTETWSITFSPQPDSAMLATAGGTRGGVVVWRLEPETRVHAELSLPGALDERSRGKEKFVLSVAYSPDGRRLACGSMDGSVGVWELGSGQYLGSLQGHHKPVRSLTFTPGRGCGSSSRWTGISRSRADSKLLLTACDDMHLNLYDVDNLSLVEAFSGHESWVLAVAAHPSGATFASGGSDSKQVKLWDLGARACIQTLAEHSDQVWAVAFNQDGSRLASGADDKAVITYSYA
ncbi:hypothetical protein QJQ45_010870 [Haematococcus lacustris]|nr:hypothetical protein QJQ45_010870 [Haematococcus lacustris]